MSLSPLTPVTPLPAATILLLRDGARGLEVLMIERHTRISFAGGALVFPGGKVDAEDRLLLAHCVADAEGDTLISRIAAIREAYEEARILLAHHTGSTDLMSADEVHAFHEHYVRTGDFLSTVLATGVTLATDLLVPIAHWITPVGLPKRFDTQFFVALGPTEQIALEDGFEAVETLWTTPQAALNAEESGNRILMVPTFFVLRKLAKSRSAAEAIEAARIGPVHPITADLIQTDDGETANIPADSGYDLHAVPWDRLLAQR